MSTTDATPALDFAVTVETAEPSPNELPVTVICRRADWRVIDFDEVWRYRELLYFLTWRDVKVRYKQTVLGAAWAVLQPFATMVVFSIFFGRMANMPSGDVAYPLFVFAGLLPWTFFANAISQAGNSVVGSQNLVTKVYFPRLFIPLSAIAAGLIDFVVAFFMLLGLMAYYGVYPNLEFLLVPLVASGLVIAALGAGSLLAALTVAYRDFRHIVPFSVQLWMFATPAVYMNSSAMPARWQLLLPLNPAHGLIASFRAACIGQPLDWYALAVSFSVSGLLLLLGCVYFRRVERSFADVI